MDNEHSTAKDGDEPQTETAPKPVSPPVPPPPPRSESLQQRLNDEMKAVPKPPPVPASFPAIQRPALTDPSWWRKGIWPGLTLLTVVIAADLLCPLFTATPYIGFGTALGSLFLVVSLLMLRKDYSRTEALFLVLLGLITATAQAVSGSVLSWVGILLIPLLMQLLPKERTEPREPARTWWGYWIARRPGFSGRTHALLPLLLSIFSGIAFFLGFLAIFASGNPVVLKVWDMIVEAWNAIIRFFHLDLNFWQHLIIWVIGLAGFGLYTFGRPATAKTAAPKESAGGTTLLPLLPAFTLLGINLAFLVATTTDTLYLWVRRVPEGISQTDYLYNGVQSIVIASVMATLLILLLFRRTGVARKSIFGMFMGYLLVVQTFILSISVLLRLYYQIDAHGFTTLRVTAAESMLLGMVGIILLLSYMAHNGHFWKHFRLALGTGILFFFGFNILTPNQVAGYLNIRCRASHPEWKFTLDDINACRDFEFIVNQYLPELLTVSDDAAYELYWTKERRRAIILVEAEEIQERNAGPFRGQTLMSLRLGDTANRIIKPLKQTDEEEYRRYREALTRRYQEISAAQRPAESEQDVSETTEQPTAPAEQPAEPTEQPATPAEQPAEPAEQPSEQTA